MHCCGFPVRSSSISSSSGYQCIYYQPLAPLIESLQYRPSPHCCCALMHEMLHKNATVALSKDCIFFASLAMALISDSCVDLHTLSY